MSVIEPASRAASDSIGEGLDVIRLGRERDLYRQLTLLGAHADRQRLLADALAVIVEIISAAHGILEVYDEHDGRGEHCWRAQHGLLEDEVQSVQLAVSRGTIAQALAVGTMVMTVAAVGEEVLCAPLGDGPPLGVLYLQGRVLPGPFTAAECDLVEIFARHFGPIARRLLAMQHAAPDDHPARSVRRRLRAEALIGGSAAFTRMLHQVEVVAPLGITVLVTGESGTGKSLVARVLHENGPRRSGPLVEVDCATRPAELAEGGTLLLKNVSELRVGAQAKLLQLLAADVRVIATNSGDLERAVAEGRFRADLFHRLQVVPIRVPSLAERREDVGDLAAAFCARALARHGLPHVTVSGQAVRMLAAMAWPGNVRQLEDVVAAASIRAAMEGAVQVEQGHLLGVRGDTEPAVGELTFQEATRRFQAGLVRKVLEENEWNVVEAGRRLDVTRSHLYDLIRAFGLDQPSR